MRYDVVRYVVGQTLRIISVPFLLAMLGNLAFALNDPDFESYPVAAFAAPGAIALIAGTMLSKGVDADEIEQRIRDREAFASVGLGWLVIVLIGTLPIGWAASSTARSQTHRYQRSPWFRLLSVRVDGGLHDDGRHSH